VRWLKKQALKNNIIKVKKHVINMKFCAKCGKPVNATKCPYCNYTQDKTYIAIKIRHSKKNFLFVGSGIFVVIIILLTLNWAVNDGYGPLYDQGDFVLFYEHTDFSIDLDLRITTENNQQIDNLVRGTKFFENIVASYNDRFKLPYDVPIYVGECGIDQNGYPVVNAFYSYDDNFMIVCYELIDFHIMVYRELYPGISDEELIDYTQGGVYWIFVHELGHAFIDIYELPLLGPSEDTADAAANIILISEGEKGINAIAAASDLFSYTAALEGESALENVFYDDHGLNIQRYMDMLCFVYGSDPNGWVFLVADGYLTTERAQPCVTTFEENYAGWAEQLKPYAKFDL